MCVAAGGNICFLLKTALVCISLRYVDCRYRLYEVKTEILVSTDLIVHPQQPSFRLLIVIDMFL